MSFVKNFLFIILSCSLLFVISSCDNEKNADKKEVHISAAASLKDAVKEIKAIFEKSHPDIRIVYDFGGSGQIRARIEGGVPTDGVLFASESDLNKLIDHQLVEFKQKFAENKLVLIEPTKSNHDKFTPLEEKLINAQKVAIGDPKSVPAGEYAKQTLEKLSLFDQLSNKLVKASDVRQVLAYVASGNADLGFVYATDVPLSKNVRLSSEIKENLHGSIGYYGGVLTDSKNKKQVKQFFRFLKSEKAQSIFTNYGFKVLK